MAEIVPTILTADQNAYQAQLATYSKFAKRIQIDISDGEFAANTTISESILAPLPSGIQFDLHMMVVHPSRHLPAILELKPALCIFHAECGEDLLPIFDQLKNAGIRAGVALMPSTYPGDVQKAIYAADHALIFAGAIGKQGGDADLIQIEKVKIIRAIKQAIEVGWDGGANMKNIRMLGHANINVINIGSALAKSENPAEAYKALVEESEKREVLL